MTSQRNFAMVSAIGAIAMTGQPASGQSFQDLRGDGASEMRVSAGITIPFGGQKRSAQSKPRLDFGADHRQRNADILLASNPVRAHEIAKWRRTSLSLTFEHNPRMLVNNLQVARFNLTTFADEDGEGNDGGKSGGGGATPWIIGGVVLLGGLTYVTLDAADELSDVFRPD